jgi:hypothetical protein
MEVKIKRRVPTIIKVFSGVFKRALPTTILNINEEILNIPIRTPISVSLDPNLER